MKKNYICAVLVALVFMAGFLIPLDSYTTTQGCPVETTSTRRLHMILGDSLQEAKQGDVQLSPNVGCSDNTKHILYLL